MYIRALYAFHLVYFVVFSATTFLPKYFGEIGLTDGQIGLLMSVPALFGVLFQPFFGALSDRVSKKKYVLIFLLLALAACCFLLFGVTGFYGLMAGLTAFHILQLPIAPAYSTISLEYTRARGVAYGPIRLTGTLGYQAGALLVGVLLSGSLGGLFPLIGAVMAFAGLIACFLPPVAGHQHGRPRVRIRTLFADRHLTALFVIILLAASTSQFYMSFFSKHLGDLGVSNEMTGVLLMVSVALEIPFLLFADRLARKMSVWNWLMIGFALNAVRFTGLALTQNVWLLMLFQLPAVSVMACFEFFPAVYINHRVDPALKGSAQTTLTIVAFGLSKVIGSLLGGLIAGRVGIPAVFLGSGLLLLAGLIVLWRPTRRLLRAEGGAPCEP